MDLLLMFPIIVQWKRYLVGGDPDLCPTPHQTTLFFTKSITMRIKQISVTDLFGRFDHKIPLKMLDQITILHSANGLGKTIIFQMVNELFNARYSLLGTVSYSSFRVEFESDRYVAIKKDLERKKIEIVYSSDESGSEERSLSFEEPSTEEDKIKIEQKMECLKQSLGWQNVAFIKAERLAISNETIAKYAAEMAATLQTKLTEYAKVSQPLEASFFARLTKRQNREKLTDREISDRLATIEKTRISLIGSGFLDESENGHFKIEELPKDEKSLNILSVYLEDAEKKLNVFGDLIEKIDKFRKTISDRFSFTGKTIDITKDEGLVIKDYDGSILDLHNLSLGEQQLLAIFYELFFKIEPNSLVLIDLPELALHIAWQNEFVTNLYGPIMLKNIDVLIATHSPDIIGESWNLTVALNKGEKQQNA